MPNNFKWTKSSLDNASCASPCIYLIRPVWYLRQTRDITRKSKIGRGDCCYLQQWGKKIWVNGLFVSNHVGHLEHVSRPTAEIYPFGNYWFVPLEFSIFLSHFNGKLASQPKKCSKISCSSWKQIMELPHKAKWGAQPTWTTKGIAQNAWNTATKVIWSCAVRCADQKIWKSEAGGNNAILL